MPQAPNGRKSSLHLLAITQKRVERLVRLVTTHQQKSARPLLRVRLAVLAYVLPLAGRKVQQPGKIETAIVNGTKHHLTVKGKKDKNPLPDTVENPTSGPDAFVSYCAVCHGKDGQNMGVAFASLTAPPVPKLTDQMVQSYSDGQLKWIISNGIYPSGCRLRKRSSLMTICGVWFSIFVIYLRREVWVTRGQPVQIVDHDPVRAGSA
jgi:hypothetical protein